MAKKEKPKQTYGSLSTEATMKIFHETPKTLKDSSGVVYDMSSKWDRMAYVENTLRSNEVKWGNIGGNYLKTRNPKTKTKGANKQHTGAGLIHIQPINDFSYFGMYDTGKEDTQNDVWHKYAPNITFHEQKPNIIYGGKATKASEALKQRLMAVRLGHSPGKAVWNFQRKYEKDEWDKAHEKGQVPSAATIRKRARMNPKNPMTYQTFEKGSMEWLQAFRAIQANIEYMHANKEKSLSHGVGQMHKKDSNYLKNVLGVK